ncbi:MAG: ubiquinone/menaquinone biosynthesis methyltransferase [Verrucomicrobiae bacterium]|nr:ubiquinone/menaquinone biosynthesis methyltransferase [Verrucomicrobiae bacterium]
MKSKFYQPGEARADQVHRLFATIARRYDLINDIMSLGLHRRWKNRVARHAGRPERSLDLCCGTGDIAQRLPGFVVGVDFTAAVLQVAAARQRNAGWVRWVRADALRLPFPNDVFDVVTVGYGLRNLADLPGGLREIHRVLRPGGRVLSLDFGKPAAWWARRLYFGYLRVVLPWLGQWFCGDRDTHAYIVDSLEDYPAQRGLVELMQTAGFVDCGYEEFWFGAMAINWGRKPSAASAPLS